MERRTFRQDSYRFLFAVLSLMMIPLIIPAGGVAFAAGESGGTSGNVLRPYAVIHAVRDLRKSESFYRDDVGLTVARSSAFPSGASPAIQALLNTSGATIKSVTLQIPGTLMRLVLLQFTGVPQKDLHSVIQDPGVVKLALDVRDIDKAFARIQKHIMGVYSTGGGPVQPEGPAQRVRAVIVKDPDGYALELILAPLNTRTTAPASSNIVDAHASIVTADLPVALKFYTEELGFNVRGALTGRPLKLSTLALEGTPGADVMSTGGAPPEPRGIRSMWFFYDFRNIDRKTLNTRMQDIGGGAVAFLVKDLPSLLERMKAGGTLIETAGGAPVMIGYDSQAVVVRDPSGIPVELVQQGGNATASE
jgi:catechol 2,3-dioxygenase-like lactoylglutathione lyase family enzyme